MTAVQKICVILVCVLAVLFCFLYFYLLFKSRKEKRLLEEKIRLLEKENRYDYMTGVLSRRAFISEIESELASNPNGTLLIFDVNGFKTVNDTYGHIAGDNLIKRYAARLLQAFGDDLVGRLGGDEFLVFVKGECDKRKINGKIKKAGIACFADKPTKLTLTSCCGAAVAPHNGVHFEDLYERADKALYHSKKTSHRIVYCR